MSGTRTGKAGNSPAPENAAEKSKLRAAWDKTRRVAKAGYYALGAVFLAAAAVYLTPFDAMPEMKPGAERVITEFKIAVSDMLLGVEAKKAETGAPAAAAPANKPQVAR